MGMEIVVTSGAIALMLAESRRNAPREACGILLGRADRIAQAAPCANVHPNPLTHFEIDPQALIDAHRAAREGGAQVAGYYHSHPSGPPHPSATDRAMAHRDGSVWAIIADNAVTFWRDGKQGFEALSYRVVDQ
jgi:proteasome lid subunit RPN8/RPN11